ncbi:MAG: hypothetical protein U9Q38_04310, partial [Thermodesulfobacteriota bacterium]|nr:hypothetical protein [Thermodesulfobacteriota bacterium]
YNKAINEIIDIIGGRYIHPIMFVNRSHWSFQRFMYDPKQKQWSYCAGQDYPAEMKQIRKFLKN